MKLRRQGKLYGSAADYIERRGVHEFVSSCMGPVERQQFEATLPALYEVGGHLHKERLLDFVKTKVWIPMGNILVSGKVSPDGLKVIFD